MKFYNAFSDCEWLRETHLRNYSFAFASFVLEGNEDSPTIIKLYTNQEPRIYDKYTTLELCDDGRYKVVADCLPLCPECKKNDKVELRSESFVCIRCNTSFCK